MPLRLFRCLTCLFVLASTFAGSARGSDWPCYAADGHRSGSIVDELKTPLALQWVYRPSQPPCPAWPDPRKEAHRIDFDYGNHPVIAGGLVFFGSTADDTVRAIDVATGRIKWHFTTDAPVRFAPAIYKGRAYIASDDGHVYCVEATTGKKVWAFRAAPKGDQIAGNGRMISRWPLRNGVLVEKGIVYVTAGMWPSEGIYVYALEAESGKVVWLNDTSGAMYMAQPHVGAYAITGVAPQGYLAISTNVLYVPTGRAVPAAFDRKTGRFLHYRQADGKSRGGCWAVVDEKTSRLSNEKNTLFANGNAYSWRRGSFRAPEWRKEHKDAVYRMALGGTTLVVGGDNLILGYAAEDGKEIWRGEVEGQVRGLATADGSLVASTSKGLVYCFGPVEEGAPAGEPKVVVDRPADAPGDRVEAPTERIFGLLEQYRTDRGYALLVGQPGSRLAEALATKTRLNVVNVLREKAEVETERKRLLETTGLYGSRIAVRSPEDLAPVVYGSYFANLIVVSGKLSGLPGRDLYRVLHPCGGVMYFPGARTEEIEKFLKEAGVPAEEVTAWNDSKLVVRGKLQGAFDWDSTVQCDHRVKWPLELLWFGGPGPSRMPNRHWAPPTPIAAGGRYFAVGEHCVIAMDAYNGTELWSRNVWNAFTRDMPGGGYAQSLTSMAADDKNVYLRFKSLCYVLDAVTGERKRIHGSLKESKRFSLDGPQTFTLEIPKQHSGTLTLAKSNIGISVTLENKDPNITEFDGWELFFDFREPGERHNLYSPGVFQINMRSEDGSWRRGAGPKHPEFSTSGKGAKVELQIAWTEIESLVGERPGDFCFAAAMVSERIPRVRRKPVAEARLFCDDTANVVNNGWAIFSVKKGMHAGATPVPQTGELADLPAHAMKWGRLPVRPKKPMYSPQRVNPLTQETANKSFKKSHGCAHPICSATMDFFRSGTISFYDYSGDGGLRHFGGIKPGCRQSSMVPALGLLISSEGSSGCRCAYNYQCSLALSPAPARRNEDWGIFHDPTDFGDFVKRAKLNFGAPGDRRDGAGGMWLSFPRPGSQFLPVPCSVDVYGGFGPYHFNADSVTIKGTNRPWIYASGYRGVKSITLGSMFYDPATSHMSLPCGEPPKIDGRLVDQCWDGAAPTLLEKGKARVRLRHDKENVYIACEIKPPSDEIGERRAWKAETTGKDAEVWKDDAFELYVGSEKTPDWLHLGVSASGARYDALWSYRVDIPKLTEIKIDGKKDDWKENGLSIDVLGKGTCRLGWNERGVLLAVELPNDFVANERYSTYGMLIMVAKPGTTDFTQIAINPKKSTYSVDCRIKGNAGAKPTTEVVVGKSAKGCVVEALIPTADLGVESKEDVEFLLPILFYDCDNVDPALGRVPDGRSSLLARPNQICRIRLSKAAGPPADMLLDDGRFSDIQASKTTRSQITVTEDTRWDGSWVAKATRDEKGTYIEMAIPLKMFRSLGMEKEHLRLVLGAHGKLTTKPVDVFQMLQDATRSVHFQDTIPKTAPRTVRLHFAEPDDVKPGERVFDVRVQGKTLLKNFDIIREAGARNTALVKELKGIAADRAVILELIPSGKDLSESTVPILSGIEIMVEEEEGAEGAGKREN
jgi:outer membrane protein assembly factor BamB